MSCLVQGVQEFLSPIKEKRRLWEGGRRGHISTACSRTPIRPFPGSGETWEMSPAVDLSAKQLDEMSTRPDMVLQYADSLAERLTLQNGARPIVRIDHRVSLNGRPYQTMIDPGVDLAAVSRGSMYANWILPLETSLSDRSMQGEY